MQAAPVLSVEKLVDEDEQFKIRGMLKEIEHPTLGKMKFLTSPLRYTNAVASTDAPPTAIPGENTDEVLRDLLNMREDELMELKGKGVIFTENKKSNRHF